MPHHGALRRKSPGAIPLRRFWYLLRDYEPLALVDSEGWVWTISGFEGKLAEVDIRKIR